MAQVYLTMCWSPLGVYRKTVSWIRELLCTSRREDEAAAAAAAAAPTDPLLLSS